jgi:hypothetical protein
VYKIELALFGREQEFSPTVKVNYYIVQEDGTTEKYVAAMGLI